MRCNFSTFRVQGIDGGLPKIPGHVVDDSCKESECYLVMNQGLMRARRRKVDAGAEAEAGTVLFHEK